ncbi:BREX system ATP-binding domain-containing protein [Micromonospora sp. NPDC126480]|uniref:BREX system ATP-binding domain-containing protein n=1 Tax=Micromonospora sp. NPDC126480 TaxID=3155312 RepID=UPI00332E4752
MDAEDLDLSGEVNPYPSSAVAQIADAGSTVVTIETPAVRRAVSMMEAYLAARDNTDHTPSGRVVAAVGDYGTGKTHLAAYLIRYATDRHAGAVQSMHLNAPPDTFVSLYRAFADRLGQRRELVHDRVRRYYADILAEELRASEATLPVAEQLASGALDPVRVVDRLSLMESEFLRQLRDRLRQVTDNVEFSQALTLLLRGGFEDAVWEWFSGRPPAEVLRERGITGTITGSESTALQAMGVFALLIGHGAHPFIVVIDELDQLLTAAGRREDEALDAFKEMLRVFAASNTFLLLAGLPDLLSSMRRDVRDRIDEQIVMSPLTAAEVQSYVLERQRGRLAPFTEQTLAYVVELANGVPRGVISLCHRLWRRARDQRSTVTHPMVRQVAREFYDATGLANVQGEIRQVLVASGYDTYVPGHLVGGTEDTRVDYWVPVGSEGAGCAILLAEPLLDEADVTGVQRRGQAIRAHADCELLLVVLGPPPVRFHDQLLEALGREALAYRPRSFVDQFAVEFKAMVARLEERYAPEGPLTTLAPQLARLDRRQSATQHMITLLAGSLDDLRGHYDQQLNAIHRELHEIQRGVSGGSADAPGHISVVTTLPAPVVQLFDDAFVSVDLMTPTRELLRRTFLDDDSGRTARQAVRSRIRLSQVQAATGITALLNALIEAFGHALVDWYRTVRSAPDGPLDVRHRERLDDLCRIFDAVYDYLPLYELRALRELVGQAGTAQQQEAEDVLSDFSERVHRELLSPFGTAER